MLHVGHLRHEEARQRGQLAPQRVWEIFSRLADAPRPSKKEEKVKAVVREIAEQAGFALREDEVGNYVVAVPGRVAMRAPSRRTSTCA